MASKILRIRYFNGLFLKEDELNLEQSYHIRMRRLHNRHLHSRGIVCGLEVKEVSGKIIRVTKGMALNRVLKEDGEEVSQEIILTEDEEMDLSGCSNGESVYIYIKYSEEKAQDEYFEPEPEKEPYWWERATIDHSTEKPFNENEYIILARVDINVDGTMQIQYAEEGESLRVYAGFSGKRIETEKLTLRIEDAFPNNLPFIEGKKFDLQNGHNGLNINSLQTNFTGSLTISDDLIIEEQDFDGQKGLNINSPQTNFTGSLTIAGDLLVKGTTTTVNTETLDVIDSIIRVNKYEPPQPEPKPVNGGLEVFRGGTAKNAQIIWDEGEDKWKIGLEESLSDIAYSDRWGKNNWEQLTNALTINDAGNVGIGTTTPEAKLDIAGNLRLRIGEGLELLGDNNYFGENNDARVFRMIDVNGSSGGVDGGIAIEGYTLNDEIRKPIMAIRGNGTVGIGTINPELRFVVDGSAGIMGHCTVGYKGSAVLNVRHIAGKRADNDDKDILFLQWDTGFGVQINRPEKKGCLNVHGKILGDYLSIRPQDTTNEGGEIQLQGTGGAGHIHIDNRQGHCRIQTLAPDKQFQVIGGGAYIAGNVGIGTMSPDTKLHVNGNIRIEGDRNFLQLKETDGNPNENFCIGVNDGLLRFNSADDNFSGLSRMVIDQKGNVGIGITTDLNAKLHISGSSGDFPDNRSLRIQVSGKSNTFADHIYITAYNNSTTDKYGIAFGGDGHHRGGIYAQNVGGTSSGDGNISIWNRHGTSINLVGGNVGIGTTNPIKKLDVHGTVYVGARDGISYGELAILRPDGGGGINILQYDQGETRFQANSGGSFITFVTNTGGSLTEKVRIANNGNVGIGTTNPSANLDVRGSLYTESISGAIKSGYVDKPGNNERFMEYTINFGQTYSYPPALIVTPHGNYSFGERPSTFIVSMDLDKAVVRVFRADGNFGSSTLYRLSWIAVGTL